MGLLTAMGVWWWICAWRIGIIAGIMEVMGVMSGGGGTSCKVGGKAWAGVKKMFGIVM